jgi:hypothetical protein
VKNAAECMKKKVFVNKGSKKQDWFDKKCTRQRKLVRQKLNRFRRSLCPNDRNEYCIVRREYKNLLYRKRKSFNDNLIKNLLDSVNDQYTFWGTGCGKENFI